MPKFILNSSFCMRWCNNAPRKQQTIWNMVCTLSGSYWRPCPWRRNLNFFNLANNFSTIFLTFVTFRCRQKYKVSLKSSHLLMWWNVIAARGQNVVIHRKSYSERSTFSFSNLLANFWRHKLTWTALTFSPSNGTNGTKSTVLRFKLEKLIDKSSQKTFVLVQTDCLWWH